MSRLPTLTATIGHSRPSPADSSRPPAGGEARPVRRLARAYTVSRERNSRRVALTDDTQTPFANSPSTRPAATKPPARQLRTMAPEGLGRRPSASLRVASKISSICLDGATSHRGELSCAETTCSPPAARRSGRCAPTCSQAFPSHCGCGRLAWNRVSRSGCTSANGEIPAAQVLLGQPLRLAAIIAADQNDV